MLLIIHNVFVLLCFMLHICNFTSFITKAHTLFKLNSIQVNNNKNSKKMMFSGIVEDIGLVDSLVVNKQMLLWDGSISEGVELTICSRKALDDAYIGCSIAVNGVCLTATYLDTDKFTVNLAPETLRKTNLGQLAVGSKVNIERALKADGRNSGHFVQGHVDGTGSILERWIEGDSLWVKVAVEDTMLKYIVPKGFVCIDGTSLTVCEVHSCSNNSSSSQYSWFTIMLVSHTQQHVIFPLKSIGDQVNIEVDVLGKLVERSLEGNLNRLESTIMSNLRNELKKKEDLIQKQQAMIELLQYKVNQLEVKFDSIILTNNNHK